MLTREEGRYTLTNYALARGVMIPMAALKIGCALFGLPYLSPGREGLSGALLVGSEDEALIRGVYQTAGPPLAFLLLLLRSEAGRIGKECVVTCSSRGSRNL